ncbi:unnamed protein product, partial [Mesorhabditis belari]|uniref:BZIP domain-containing protein n=1 Tax=Mesorhabditis belari TaxID=2138241 RepID=A0AAF3ELG5_9BILA
MPEMEDEDYDKKLKRRQRNKEAAARCRQRRLELMQTLQDQVDKQRDDNRKKDVQIKDLRNQINDLHRFLQNHDCKMSPEQRQAHMNISIPNTSQNIPPPSSSPQTHPIQSTAVSTNALSNAHSGGPLLPPQTHMTQPMKARNISTKVPSYGASLQLVSSDRKRPLPHADVFAAKLPKPEQTLAQLNMNGTEDLARPDRLFDMPSTNASVGSSSSTVLVTPSQGLGSTPYQPNNSLSGITFGNIPYTPGASNLLDGPTGITPITSNPVPIFESRITGDVRGDLESL